MSGVKADVNGYLSGLVGRALVELEQSYCVERDEDGRGVYATVLARIASYYYLAHHTVKNFRDSLRPDMTTAEVLQVTVMQAAEYRSSYK
jgi:activating signal cointegrator complex subunit 3